MRVVSFVRTRTEQVAERDVALNEVFGFVTRCALQAAGHTTDYVIDEGTADLMGGARTERLLELAKKAGYLTPIKHQGVRAYLLVDDPLFLHMRRKAEIEWERQRKADNANPMITAPVRLRDGDECRYCGNLTNWRDRKGGHGGTYDHRVPGQPATIATLVVACISCNAGRRDDPEADLRYPLRPEPLQPFYSAITATFLTNAGHHVQPTEDRRPGSQPDTAASDRAASATPLPPRTPRAPVAVPGSADHLPAESGFAGTGRDGTGGGARSSTAMHPTPGRRRKRPQRGRPRPSTEGLGT